MFVVATTPLINGQTLRTSYSFSGLDGTTPSATLTVGSDGSFYGTTAYGGPRGDGTVFRLGTNGTFTSLADFFFSNGAYPKAALTLGQDGNLYGTTSGGGNTNSGNITDPNGFGTIFRVTTNGLLSPLFWFSYTNGAYPLAELTLGNNGNFYGTTAGGSGAGTVFMVTTNGVLSTLVSFPGPHASPHAGLAYGADGNFYGSTYYGGNTSQMYPNGLGTIFKMTPNGTLTTVLAFNSTNGAFPQGTLTLGSDGNLYGTTFQGGRNSDGTVFKLSADGTLKSLVSFSGSDGSLPQTGVIVGNSGSLYGTTLSGGAGGVGTVFQVATDGTLSTLASFSTLNPYPVVGLTIGRDGNFWGTTSEGGGITNSSFPYGMGTVFNLSCPEITIQPQDQVFAAGENVTLYATLGPFGTPPYFVQWFSNGVPIFGATHTTFTINNFDVGQAGAYSVMVSNSNGQETASKVLRLPYSPVIRVDGVDVGGGTVSRTNASQITMASNSGGLVFYTLDGTAPCDCGGGNAIYWGPFTLKKTAAIWATAYSPEMYWMAMAAPITVQITPAYSLQTPTLGGGTVTVSPAPYITPNIFVSNTPVTVTATASKNWSFIGWLGDAQGSAAVLPVLINRDLSMEALFGTGIISNVVGAGSIQFSPQLPAYPYGSAIRLTAIPSSGSYFVSWFGALSGSNNPITLIVTNPSPVVSALFQTLPVGQYSLTVLAQGAGAVSVAPYTNRYPSGTVVTLKAIPNPGQSFTGWSGDASGVQNPMTLTMTQSKVITASFTSHLTLVTTPESRERIGQGFSFSVFGDIGIACRIDGSTNLSNWAPLGWLTNVFGTTPFLDTSALTNTAQLYRAVTQ